MKVLRRSQVTEIITKRNVYHTIELNGKKYNRIESINIRQPYMNCDEPIITNTKIKWSVYVGERTVSYLSAKEVKQLKLNELFEEIDLNARNGNE